MNVYETRSDRWLRRQLRRQIRKAWSWRKNGYVSTSEVHERVAASIRAEIDRRASQHA